MAADAVSKGVYGYHEGIQTEHEELRHQASGRYVYGGSDCGWYSSGACSAAKKSEGLYGTVNMLIKCVFYSAEWSQLITDNPCVGISAKGGKPIPKCLVDCRREAKANSISEYVISDSEGQPLSYSQFTRVWQYVVVRSTKERTYYKYVNGQSIKYTVKLAAAYLHHKSALCRRWP